MTATRYRISFERFRVSHKVTEAERRAIKSIKKTKRLEGAAETISRVGQALSAAGVTWWLSYGVLLGFVRQNGFVEGDNDVDIMIAPGTEPRKIADVMHGLGGASLTTISLGNKVTNENYWYNDIYFDFYYGHDWHGQCTDISRFAGCACHLPHDLRGLESKKFKGLPFVIPSHVTDYLKSLYGNGWQTPDPSWNWKIQTTPLEISGSPARLAYVYTRREILKR